MASGSAWWIRTTKARRPVTQRASHIHGWLVGQTGHDRGGLGSVQMARDTSEPPGCPFCAIATPYPLRLFLKAMRARSKRFHTPAPRLEVDGTEPTRKFSFGRLR